MTGANTLAYLAAVSVAAEKVLLHELVVTRFVSNLHLKCYNRGVVFGIFCTTMPGRNTLAYLAGV
jgi:hypothetical protein